MLQPVKQIAPDFLHLNPGCTAGLTHYLNKGVEKAVRVNTDGAARVIITCMYKKKITINPWKMKKSIGAAATIIIYHSLLIIHHE
jgi:hypothetical protein